MKRVLASLSAGVALAATVSFLVIQRRAQAVEGYVIERDAEVAKQEGGPHKGAGRTTGYNFFARVPDFKLSFRKRVLHPGASIGYHPQETDEVYYVVGGQGRMTINGQEMAVKPGDAILTRKGSSHGLAQTGDGDLTIIIAYDK
ncbi:MAG TPA: cupin domain-containing protein [Pyrinomonadaceae bacterium]|jgi:mannose-6-phosphate isomerase-like protein (cupin superfamily)